MNTVDFTLEKDSTLLNIEQYVRDFRSSGFIEYPPLALETSMEPSSEDYAKREKEVKKFLSRVQKITPVFEDVWDFQHIINGKLDELIFISKNIRNQHSLEYFLASYAMFDAFVLFLNKKIKKAEKGTPEAATYYEQYRNLVDINVFDMMANDLKKVYENAKEHSERLCHYDSKNKMMSLEEALASYKQHQKEQKNKVKDNHKL